MTSYFSRRKERKNWKESGEREKIVRSFILNVVPFFNSINLELFWACDGWIKEVVRE